MNTEQDLLKQIRENGVKALESTYLKYRTEFFHWAKKNFNTGEEESQDVYQNAFLIFYENVMSGKLDHLTSSPKTYLFAIGRNKLMEISRVSTKFVNDPIDEQLMEGIEEDDAKINDEPYLNLLEQNLKELGNPCQQILELFYYHKNSMNEIGQKLGYKNTETVKNQKYKCLQRLKKLMSTNKLDLIDE